MLERHWLFVSLMGFSQCAFESLNSSGEMQPRPLRSRKCKQIANTGCLREVAGRSYCRYLRRWLHLSQAMEGIRKAEDG